MTTRTQVFRPLALGTSLPEDTLLIMSAQISEQLGQMFQIHLRAVSEDHDIKFSEIVGQNVTLRLRHKDGSERLWNGFVANFNQAGPSGDLQQYNLTVVPWLWFLGRTADFRVYQDMTVPDIILSIFREGGFSDFETNLHGTYPKWEYCVQYRETDLNFIHRLMEQEGIYYFFKHQDGKHTLMLCDSPANHEPTPGWETILYRPSTGGGEQDHEYIFDWTLEQRLQPGAYETMDYDFKNPRKLLKARVEDPKAHAANDFDVFDFPGEWENPSEGEHYTRIRLEELHAQHEIANAVTNAQGVAVGHTFKLADYPREDQNVAHLITSTSHSISLSEFSSGDGGGETDFSCTFTAIKAQTQFRPARITPKPVIQGPQTAVVVGPAGEEIYTDEFGRIKVQFHWDRYGKKNEKSSCWMRVVQSWAGNKFGGGIIPRIGMEVIVSFLEGDPDCPVVTGCLYNGENKMPDELPTKKTRSVFKTNSSKGGGGFNMLRMDDIKGKEQVFIHSQHRMDVRAKQNYFDTCGGARHTSIGDNLYITCKEADIHYAKPWYQLCDDKLMQTVTGAAVMSFGANLAQFIKTKYELNAQQIVVEAMTSISFKVGANFITIDASGVTIQGTITKINCMGFGQETGDSSVDDPMDAAVADTGEPGWLDRPSGGPWKRKSHKLSSQHAVAVAKATDTPQMARIRAILAQSPTGRRSLEVFDRYGMQTANKNGTNGEWDSPNNTVILGPATKSDDDAALTFVHEMNHAQSDKEGRSADVNNQTRADYINTQLAEDAHGERLAQQTAEELTDAGHPVTYNSSTANSYNNGVNAAKTANPNATPDQLHDAGEQSMLNDYKNGTITTGNTNPPQTYVNYWGSYYDSVHPPPPPPGP